MYLILDSWCWFLVYTSIYTSIYQCNMTPVYTSVICMTCMWRRGWSLVPVTFSARIVGVCCWRMHISSPGTHFFAGKSLFQLSPPPKKKLVALIRGKKASFFAGGENLILGWSMYYIKHNYTIRSGIWAVILSRFRYPLPDTKSSSSWSSLQRFRMDPPGVGHVLEASKHYVPMVESRHARNWWLMRGTWVIMLIGFWLFFQLFMPSLISSCSRPFWNME